MFVGAGSNGSTDMSVEGVFKIYTTEQGDRASAPTVDIAGVHLGSTAGAASTDGNIVHSISAGFTDAVSTTTESGIASTDLSMDAILSDLQNLANARAKNGALQSRLGFAYDNAAVSKSNMEAARSRIIDVDIAEESTNFAKYNILTQASASILSQANQTGRTALQLLMG